jgi:cellulose synthase/poly-beta-1,6-N-acetylglucosamine synthase-like glycosyltransferase
VDRVWLSIYIVSSLGLAVYGVNSLYLTWRYRRVGTLRHPSSPADGPSVTVQLPLYNELNVVERLLERALEFDYPSERLVVQVLDDSNDGTSALVAESLSRLSNSETISAGAGEAVVYQRAVPGEVPADMNALKGQQFRWAKGSVQTAIKLLPRVLRSPLPISVKTEAVVHLLGYFVHPFMLGLLVSAAFLVRDFPSALSWLVVGIAFAVGPPLLVVTGQKDLYPDWRRRILLMPVLIMLGTGVAVVCTRAVIEALLRISSGFVRTPKRGDGPAKAHYRAVVGLTPLLEFGVIVLAGYTAVGALQAGRLTAIPFLTLYAAAFGFVFVSSLVSAFRSLQAPASGR